MSTSMTSTTLRANTPIFLILMTLALFSLTACDEEKERANCDGVGGVYEITSYRSDTMGCGEGQELLGTDEVEVQYAALTCTIFFGFPMVSINSCESIEACRSLVAGEENDPFSGPSLRGDFSYVSGQESWQSSGECMDVTYSRATVERSGNSFQIVDKSWSFESAPVIEEEDGFTTCDSDFLSAEADGQMCELRTSISGERIE